MFTEKPVCKIKDIENNLLFKPIAPKNELKIMLITQGNAEIYIDGKRESLAVGDIAVAYPQAICTAVADNVKLREIVIDLQNAKNSEISRYAHFLNGNSNAPTYIKNNADNIIYKAVNSLDAQDETTVEKLLKALVDCRQGATSLTDNKQRYAANLLLHYIYENYAANITVDKAAKACGYSEFYTMKLFKQFTGTSIVDYANKYRVYLARDLLKNTQTDICKIAVQVGYENISYFNRQFKKAYGITPKEYRKANSADLQL